MSKGPLYRRTSWLLLVALLSGGCLLQAATSCNAVAAEAVAGITSSVVNSLIYNSVLEAFGLPPSNTGLGSGLTGLTGSGLGGLGT